MSTRPRFILPTELKLKLTPEGIDIEYDGDVELEQDLGQSLHKVIASGDLTVKLQRVTGSLQCGGTLRIHGEIDAEHIHGREVVLGRQKVRCTSISANERITVGAASLTVDAIIAPEINLDPKASGRVTVIESDNDRGATKIKGGFSVSDYDDMFGNADEFLAQRGLQRLGEAGPAPGRAVISSAVHDPPEVTEEEDTSDPLSLSLEDLEPLVDHPEPQIDNGEMQQRLSDALGRITACYEGADLPPAIEELRELVQQRDYDALRQNITEVWNGLLGFHQKRGIRPHHQVTHAFNIIHNLVQT